MGAKKLFFPKRIPEPKAMDAVEQRTFCEASSENYKRWMVPLVDDVVMRAGVSRGRILDVACGPGLLVREFARRSPWLKVIGIDNSAVALRFARQNCKGLKNVSFVRGDVYHLPFVSGSFDVVVCKDSFHHFNKPGRAIKEMWRVLRLGGILYIQDLRRDLPHYLIKRVTPPKNIFERLVFYSSRAAYTKVEIIAHLRRLGIPSFAVYTRKLRGDLQKRYRAMGIDSQRLREAFQSRYVVLARKR